MTRKTDEELLAESQALDTAYAEADLFDAVLTESDEEEHEDEMAILHKAALNRGQP